MFFTTNTPLVSIIIPNFNKSIYLDDCLKSIIGQTYKNTEIIIVDDNSNDNSVDIIESYKVKYSNIQLIVNAKNSGVSVSRNNGIKRAKGEYICTLDSDDYLSSNMKIEKELSTIKEYQVFSKKRIAAYSGVETVDNNNKRLKVFLNNDSYNILNCFRTIITRKKYIPRDFLVHRDVYFEAGLYTKGLNLYEDWDLKIRMAKLVEFKFSGVVGIAYRQTGVGLSNTKKILHLKTYLKIFYKNIRIEKSLLKRCLYLVEFNLFIIKYILKMVLKRK